MIQETALSERDTLALMENFVRDDITDLDDAQLAHRGLYEILRTAGVNFRPTEQRIGAATANHHQARLLGTEVGAALVHHGAHRGGRYRPGHRDWVSLSTGLTPTASRWPLSNVDAQSSSKGSL